MKGILVCYAVQSRIYECRNMSNQLKTVNKFVKTTYNSTILTYPLLAIRALLMNYSKTGRFYLSSVQNLNVLVTATVQEKLQKSKFAYWLGFFFR